jgi:hypothetical protein
MKLNLQKYDLSEEVTSGTLPIRFHSNSDRSSFVRCNMEEVWKPVVGCEGRYDVSSMGRVRSYCRSHGRARELKPSLTHDGYYRVSLRKDGKRKVWKIHSLVLVAFIGIRPVGMECCHKDNNRLNNRIENLCWDTHWNNMYSYGSPILDSQGQNNGNHKLSNEDIAEIRAHSGPRGSLKGLAKRYGILYGTVWSIRSGKSWRHIK